MIDILSIEPHKVSPSLEGKSFFFYGAYKTGKTTIASRFPSPILVGFEKGWNLIDGIRAQPVNSWYDAMTVQQQLIQLREQYNMGQIPDPIFRTVILDTADIAYVLCEQYILEREKKNYLDETESKRGYEAVKREFDAYIQQLAKAGYTVVIISHSKVVQRKNKRTGEVWEQITPTVADRAMNVIARFADVVGYVTTETDDNGIVRHYLTMRADPNEIICGTRAKYMSEKIELSYDALEADMKQAVERELEEKGTTAAASTKNLYLDQTEKRDFKEVQAEIGAYAQALADAGGMSHYKAIVERYLGRNQLVMDCDESQIDILMMILDGVKAKANELGVLIPDKSAQKPAKSKSSKTKATA